VATLILLGFAVNLFTVCALLLVVGMAFDDAIFFGFHAEAAPTALAVLLSAITTLISFGLLSLSSTPVVRDFGVTLALASPRRTFWRQLPRCQQNTNFKVTTMTTTTDVLIIGAGPSGAIAAALLMARVTKSSCSKNNAFLDFDR